MLERLIIIAAILLFAAAILVPGILRAQGFAGMARSGEHTHALMHRGEKRTFLLHVPAQSQGAPLVIVLHGGGGTGRKVARLTGFSNLARKEGSVVVYPDAVNGHWNDGRNVERFRAQRENIDDTGFIAALVDRLVKQLKVDRSRVYVTGISNGGMMCHRLGCELADRLAAIAPVAAALPEALPDSCPPGRPVPVLAINGTEDPFVPWGGGGVGLLAKRGSVRSVAQTIDFWVRRNRCDPGPETVELPDQDPEDKVSVARTAYGPEERAVILYTVRGGGHTWPGGTERPARFGRRSIDLDATETIWQFFRTHRRMP